MRNDNASAVPRSEGPSARDQRTFPVLSIPVARIRPEAGLGRKRDRDGHRELQRSIARFGVLTPITVRAADGGDFLLIKGQGRTLACQLLGINEIPAVVVDEAYAETQKVQQFLVENVARLKMRPVDRALLIQRAREDGEETSAIAKRFGLTPSTVRRLLTQLDGATSHEVEALRSGNLNLATHAAIARYVDSSERAAVLEIVSNSSLKAKEVEALFVALGWKQLVELVAGGLVERLALFSWACQIMSGLPQANTQTRIEQLAAQLPTVFDKKGRHKSAVAQ